MMRYTVVWDPDVQNALLNAWVAGESMMRWTLTAIADWIDSHLAEDADLKGQPGGEPSSRTIDVPLSITSARVEATYRVFPDDRLVRLTRLVFRIK